jgi:hypothetical protein
MFFNGLIRPYGNIDASVMSEFIRDFIAKQSDTEFASTISLFNDSQWMVLDVAYKDPKALQLYVEPPREYHDLVKAITQLIGQEYYVVQSMIAWMPPGTEISKHVDLQKIYTETRRLHVQLLQSPRASISSYAGNKEFKFNFSQGSVYEINNRVYHSAINNSRDEYYAILILDLATKDKTFIEQDNIDKNPALPNSNNLPVNSYH